MLTPDPKDGLLISHHAAMRALEREIPDRVMEALLHPRAYKAQVWATTYQNLSRDELARRSICYARIVRSGRRPRDWWIAYQDDHAIMTVVSVEHRRIRSYLAKRLVNPREHQIENILTRAPVVR